MKRWPTKRVEEVCNLVRGSSPRPKSDPRYYGGPIPRLTITDITRDGWLVTPRLDSLTELGATMSRPIEAGTIVMAVSGNVGLCAELAVDACVHDGFVAFKDLRKDLFTPSFFGLAMSQMGATHERNKAGAIFQNITTSDVKAMPIPMPPLAEQTRIVKLLDEANELRKLRARADRRTAELIPALFHEMFGDPAKNRLNLPVRELGSLCKVVGGGTPSKKQPTYWNGTTPWVSPKDMSGDEIHDSEDHISGEAIKESATNLIPTGSILVVTRSGILKHTLPVAINAVPVTINQDIKAFVPTGECESTFLAAHLRVSAPTVLGTVRVGATVQSLETNALKRLLVLCPPLSRQKEFARRVTEIRDLEAAQATSRAHLDALFQSTLHRAFEGTL